MSLAETLLVIGTFGICTGVWVTLAFLVKTRQLKRGSECLKCKDVEACRLMP